MAINAIFESCDELFSGRSGTPFDPSGKREYIRRFRVRVFTKYIGSLGVCYCPGLPYAFSPYNSGGGLEYDLAALMVSIQSEQESEDDWASWIITCKYSTELPAGGKFDYGNPGSDGSGGDGENVANNPEFEPPEIDWDFETDTKVVTRDLDGKPIVNSAGQPFDPPLSFDQAYAVLTFTRNQVFFNRQMATDFSFAVNKTTFLGAPPGAAQCMPPRAKRVFKGSISYWRVTWRVRFSRPDTVTVLGVPVVDLATWQPRILDIGTMQKVLFDSVQVPIWRGGQPVPGPIMLDGDGHPAPLNEDGTITPTYLDFRIFVEQEFAELFQIKPGEATEGLE